MAMQAIEKTVVSNITLYFRSIVERKASQQSFVAWTPERVGKMIGAFNKSFFEKSKAKIPDSNLPMAISIKETLYFFDVCQPSEAFEVNFSLFANSDIDWNVKKTSYLRAMANMFMSDLKINEVYSIEHVNSKILSMFASPNSMSGRATYYQWLDVDVQKNGLDDALDIKSAKQASSKEEKLEIIQSRQMANIFRNSCIDFLNKVQRAKHVFDINTNLESYPGQKWENDQRKVALMSILNSFKRLFTSPDLKKTYIVSLTAANVDKMLKEMGIYHQFYNAISQKTDKKTFIQCCDEMVEEAKRITGDPRINNDEDGMEAEIFDTAYTRVFKQIYEDLPETLWEEFTKTTQFQEITKWIETVYPDSAYLEKIAPEPVRLQQAKIILKELIDHKRCSYDGETCKAHGFLNPCVHDRARNFIRTTGEM